MDCSRRNPRVIRSAAMALAAVAGLAMSTPAHADEAQAAKDLFKAMSDYMTSQEKIQFTYDASLEIVTTDLQKVTFANSGAATLARPDKLRFTRTGGFADFEMVADGKSVTAFGKNRNVFAKEAVEGSVDEVLDTLTFDYDLQAPAADLLSSNPYDRMMDNVDDAKDLGSGVIGGKECNHLAFRTKQTDWEIWIAQGDAPHPCRFTITSKMMAMAPSYTIQITSWKTGEDVPADDFTLSTGDAKEIKLEDMAEGFEIALEAAKGGAQ
jgi:hypothetical protein